MININTQNIIGEYRTKESFEFLSNIKPKNKFNSIKHIEQISWLKPYLWFFYLSKHISHPEWWSSAMRMDIAFDYINYRKQTDAKAEDFKKLCASSICFNNGIWQIVAIQGVSIDALEDSKDSHDKSIYKDVFKEFNKYTWINVHNLLFLVNSFICINLWMEEVRIIKDDYSERTHNSVIKNPNKKIAEYFKLEEYKERDWRDKNTIIQYIAKLPIKQRELIFELHDMFFENIRFKYSHEKEYIINYPESRTTMQNEIKAELINCIRQNTI